MAFNNQKSYRATSIEKRNYDNQDSRSNLLQEHQKSYNLEILDILAHVPYQLYHFNNTVSIKRVSICLYITTTLKQIRRHTKIVYILRNKSGINFSDNSY